MNTATTLAVRANFMESARVWTAVALILIFVLLAMNIMGFFSSKNQFDVDGRVGFEVQVEVDFVLIVEPRQYC